MSSTVSRRVGIGGGWIVFTREGSLIELAWEKDGRAGTLPIEGPLAAQEVAAVLHEVASA